MFNVIKALSYGITTLHVVNAEYPGPVKESKTSSKYETKKITETKPAVKGSASTFTRQGGRQSHNVRYLKNMITIAIALKSREPQNSRQRRAVDVRNTALTNKFNGRGRGQS